MHRASIVQSPSQAGSLSPLGNAARSSLHPVLQAALQSIDGQLEAELIRYRRQRALGKTTYFPRPLAQRQVAHALHLMATPSTTEPLPSSSASSGMDGFHPTATVPPLAAIAPTVAPDPDDSTSLELKELAKQYATQVAIESDLTATLNGGPDDYLESSEELLRTLAQEQAQVEAEQGFMQSLLTPLGVGSMLLLLMSSALFGFVIMNPSSVSQLFANRQPRSGGQPGESGLVSPELPAASAPHPNLATQEFPELSLGNLGAIPADESARGGTPPTAPTVNAPRIKITPKTANLGVSGVGQTVPPTASAPGVPALPQAAPQVNEPAEPAPPAGDIPSPRKLAPAPRYNPPVSTYRPAAPSYRPPQPSNRPSRPSESPPPVRAYAPPAKPIPVVPIPATPKPVPTTPIRDRTPLPPAPASASGVPTPTNSSTYKVVTPYTSDKTLEDYRGKVPDAYVKNYSDGAKVQFGAYQDESAAKSQAEQLRQQGIPAEVYKP
ncbi:MAG: hypothetical protein NW220_23955 [Leptolyngbyaceae cyanobacterium bins.349]|nr:hypothetical protein [Leptolyngbyaceae cyanobacterium bins.349]